jgi:hypothetical protein
MPKQIKPEKLINSGESWRSGVRQTVEVLSISNKSAEKILLSIKAAEELIKKTTRMDSKNISGVYPGLVNVAKAIMMSDPEVMDKKTSDEIKACGEHLNKIIRGRVAKEWLVSWDLWPLYAAKEIAQSIVKAPYNKVGVETRLDALGAFVIGTVGEEWFKRWLVSSGQKVEFSSTSNWPWWLSDIKESGNGNSLELMDWSIKNCGKEAITENIQYILQAIDFMVGKPPSDRKDGLLKSLAVCVCERTTSETSLLSNVLPFLKTPAAWKLVLENLDFKNIDIQGNAKNLLDVITSTTTFNYLESEWSISKLKILNKINGFSKAALESGTAFEKFRKSLSAYLDKDGVISLEKEIQKMEQAVIAENCGVQTQKPKSRRGSI